MSITLQRKLVMDVDSLCVLRSVSGARDRLTSLDEDDILAAVVEHTLAPAFDIGLSSDRVLRITPSAVDFFLQTSGVQRRRISERAMFEEILRGHDGKAWITGERVRLILNCGSTHIINLIEAGEFAQMPGTSYRRGPNGSAQITLVSFKEFMKRRLA